MLSPRRRVLNVQSILLLAISLVVPLTIGVTSAKMIDVVTSTATETIAKWSVSAVSSMSDVEVVAGNGISEYSFMVTNNSEVASNYEVVITGAPEGIIISLDDGAEQTVGANGILTISETGSALALSGGTRSHRLKIRAPLEIQDSTSDITVSVKFEQEKPGDE